MTAKTLTQKLLDTIYPRNCVCCLCNTEAHLDSAHSICPNCAAELRHFDTTLALPHVNEFRAALYYGKAVAKSVHKLKYSGDRYLCDFFASFIKIPSDWRIDAIVPAPMYKKIQIKRGYNQAQLIAKAVADAHGIPLRLGLLTKMRQTERQATLNAHERTQNLLGAFSAAKECADLRILIIDDVCTTGSTLSECASELKKAGVTAVYAYTACYTEAGKSDGQPT